MDSESARMSSAAEAKFRIDGPNSKPRAVKVIALDAPSERVVKDLAQGAWQGASFLTASAFSTAPRQGERFSMGGWLNDLAGRTKDLIAEVETADLVVMVASAGENAAAAAIIGEACAVKHVMTTALILGGATASDETLSKMLSALRPHTMMLVIASADEYIRDMLTALRA
jgi:tRNA A37 threonylcarbamoyltransferase TsaD